VHQTPNEPAMLPRSPEDSALTLTMFMQPEHSNSLGNVHGGVILKLCDECGGIVASRHARRPAVTVSVDRVNFLQPVLLGRLLLVHNSAYFVYVALDDERRPTSVPPLLLATAEDRRRFDEGAARHQRRMADARRHP